jgi:proteic killer suppression protein
MKVVARTFVSMLEGDRQGRWSISVTGAWRLTFLWESGDGLELDLEQYL